MANTYIKPKTKTVRIELQNLITLSPPLTSTEATKDGNGDYNDARGLGFFFEEEEVTSEKDDDDWEEWEDEDP